MDEQISRSRVGSIDQHFENECSIKRSKVRLRNEHLNKHTKD